MFTVQTVNKGDQTNLENVIDSLVGMVKDPTTPDTVYSAIATAMKSVTKDSPQKNVSISFSIVNGTIRTVFTLGSDSITM